MKIILSLILLAAMIPARGATYLQLSQTNAFATGIVARAGTNAGNWTASGPTDSILSGTATVGGLVATNASAGAKLITLNGNSANNWLWQVNIGGVSFGGVTNNGSWLFPDGTAANPSIAWASDFDGGGTGFYRSGANLINFAINGVSTVVLSAATLTTPGTINMGGDTFLLRDGAANTLALRNGTNAQAFNVYNTYTDASNYERGELSWIGNVFSFGTRKSGTGTGRAFNLITDGTARWQLNTSGHFIAYADNTYDIGASGVTRPRSIYAGTSIFTGQAGAFAWPSRSIIRSPADGVVELLDAAETSFNRIQFGGTSSSFPSLKRNGTGIDVRLADDSAYAPLTASIFTLTNASTSTTPVTINHASGATADILSANVGGVSKLSVTANGAATFNGQIIATNGNAAAPSFGFANDSTTGPFRPTASTYGISVIGTERARLTSTDMRYPSSWSLGFSGSASLGSALDAYLSRNAAGVVQVNTNLLVPAGAVNALNLVSSNSVKLGSVSTNRLLFSEAGIVKAMTNGTDGYVLSADSTSTNGGVSWIALPASTRRIITLTAVGADGVGCTFVSPPNYNGLTGIFSHEVDQDSNYLLFRGVVPFDINTAQDLRLESCQLMLLGADTGSESFRFDMSCSAPSTIYEGASFVNPVVLNWAGDAAGANMDAEYPVLPASPLTLTNWSGSLSAGRTLLVRWSRDGDSGNDSSTTDSLASEIQISYTPQ